MCRKHHDEMIGMAVESAHESRLDLEEEMDTGTEEEKMETGEDEEDEENEGKCEEKSDPSFKYPKGTSKAQSFFYKFAKAAGESRLRTYQNYAKIGKRAINYKVSNFGLIVQTIAGYIADSTQGKEEIISRLISFLQGKPTTLDEDYIAHEILTSVAEMYNKAGNTHEQTWILAPMTKIFPYPTVAQYIDGLTYYRWNLAIRMARDQRASEVHDPLIRERYDPVKLEFFVNFITR